MSEDGPVAGELERAREAFDRQAWGEAHALLAEAGALDPDDLERLAVAAHLVGHDDESDRAWEQAHLARARLGDADGAVRCAFWLALALLLRGETAQAGGWLARAERLAEGAEHDGAARGLLLVTAFVEALDANARKAQELAGEMVEIAQRCGDKDLLAFGVLSSGEAAIALGDSRRGMRLLDEVMVLVTTGEVSPIPAGIVYCAVIAACMDALDVQRAAQWTEALGQWCASQPDLVPYRGQCLVHRSQILQAHGAWVEAATEVARARERLSHPPHPALGLALYQQGELHRLRGELAEAEAAYREASELGHEPVPGFALLRLAEGKVASALATAHRMLEESRGRLTRLTALAAAVEVLLAGGDVAGARSASDELSALAATRDALLVRAPADHARGAVLLAEGETASALPALRDACSGFRAVGMPYEEARSRVLLSRACRALGDHDAADMELDAARAAFERLGAPADLAGVAAMAAGGPSKPAMVLTDRECEVLRLVAGGRTNRQIAADLVISEHTVARHVQNIFMKLTLTSRAAATAYAYEHNLV